MKCLNCRRDVRPNGTSSADYPNTVAVSAKGLCGACYRRQRLNSGYVEVAKPAEPDYNDSPCVLVRVDLTPATYKTLKSANVDIAAVMAAHANSVAAAVRLEQIA